LRDSMVCPLCDKNFRQLHILRKHKEIEHKFACNGCDKKFTMKHWLKEHMKVVHDIEDELKPSLKCELCDNIFNDNYGFRKHQKIEHTYSCSFCCKRFTMKKFLNTHQFYVHNLVAPGMKVPTQDQKEEAIIKAFKEEMKELKQESLKREDPYFRIKTEVSEVSEFAVKCEPLDEHEINEMNGSNGFHIKEKTKSRKPPPPLIKIENILSQQEVDSEEETESPFINDVVDVMDMQSFSEGEEEEEEENEEINDICTDLVSVRPQYESSDQDSEEEEEEDGVIVMEPFVQIEEDQDTS